MMAIIKNCLCYSSGFLRRIGPLAKFVSNYNSFHIDTPFRAWIIALGIRSSPVKFRRGRAGKNLFYHIDATTNRQHHEANYRRACRPLQAVNWNNVLIIKMRYNSLQLQPILAHQDDLHGALINCRSVINKTQEIQLELIRNNLDLCILTETWVKEGDTITPTRLCPNGYKSLSISRQDKIGGGIAIVYKSELNICSSRDEPHKTMESSSFIISTGNKQLILTAIYRPSNTNVLEFCNKLASLLETNINSSSELLLLGNFNIAVNKPSNAGPATFLDVLDSFNLVNKVDKPIHRLANTLDLIILDANSSMIPRVKVDWLFSDHNIILFDMSLPHTIITPKVKVYRKLKNINPEVFIRDIGEFCLCKPIGTSLEDKVNYYHTMLQSILDIHAPIKRHECSNQPSIPWFNQEIAEVIRHRRHLKRVWYREKSNMEALALFHSQC